MARGKSPEDAAQAAFVNISTSQNSTQARTVLFRRLAVAFQDPRLETLADRYDGIGLLPGTKPTDDSKALQTIRDLWPVSGSSTVGLVARKTYPGDERAQVAASHRYRRKLKAEGFSLGDKRTD